MTISPRTFPRYAKDSAPQLFTFHSAAICQDWICLERCFGTRADKSHKMNLTRSCSIQVWHWPRSLKPHSQAGVAINHQSRGGLFPSLLLYLDHGRGGALMLLPSRRKVSHCIKVQHQQRGEYQRKATVMEGEQWLHKQEDRWCRSGESQGQIMEGRVDGLL